MSRRRPAPRSSRAAHATGAGLDAALTDLRRVTDLGADLMAPALLSPARALLDRAEERRALAPDVTVVALAGSTGAGKSSLLNALVGTQLARTAVTRPTTTSPLAVLDPAAPATAAALLDWLAIGERTVAPHPTGMGGDTVLVDLPDIDSDEPSHRATASRLAGLVDVLVWVLDPEKYADAVLHRDFLAPMAAHAEVTIVVLNQVDRLTATDRQAVLADAARLLASEGLTVAVEAVSARTGEGLNELTARVATVAGTRAAARERLAADLRTEASRLVALLGLEQTGAAGEVVAARDRDRLMLAARRAAGVDAVAQAVAASDRLRAGHRVGWLPVRWLSRLRRDPLRRLHLTGPGAQRQGSEAEDLVDVVARSSLPAPGPVSVGVLTSAVHTVVDRACAELSPEAGSRILERVDARTGELFDALDAAVAATDVEAHRTRAWWSVANVVQWLCALMALAGTLWLAGLALADRLFLITPGVPHLGRVPWPTVLLLGGLALGAVLALAGVGLARLGAARCRTRVRRRLEAAVDAVVEEQVLAPLDANLAAWQELAGILERLMDPRR